MEKELLVKLMTELGFPVVIALVSIFAVFFTLKHILCDVTTLLDKILGEIVKLKNKVKNISNDITSLDMLVSDLLGVKLDFNKLFNKKEKDDDN